MGKSDMFWKCVPKCRLMMTLTVMQMPAAARRVGTEATVPGPTIRTAASADLGSMVLTANMVRAHEIIVMVSRT